MRLDKLLSHAGYGSRKEVKQLLKKSQITVNGLLVKDGKYSINEAKDQVMVDGKEVKYYKDLYYMLYKPKGVITATEDRHHRTVMDLIQSDDFRKDLFPVGRLDKDTTGLLLLTTDGPLAHELLSPKKHVDKEYHAKIRGIVTQKEANQFSQGLMIDGDEKLKPAKLLIQSVDTEAEESDIILCIQEGKYHQVKRMFQAVGMKVLSLHRHRMGQLTLDSSLQPGQYRPLTNEEISQLKVKGGC